MTKTEKAKNLFNILASRRFSSFNNGDFEAHIGALDNCKSEECILEQIADLFKCEDDPIEVSTK